MDEEKSLLDVNYCLSECEKFYKIVEENGLANVLCVLNAEVACRLAERGYDPHTRLNVGKALLRKYPAATDIVLLLFAQTISKCSPLYLDCILKMC